MKKEIIYCDICGEKKGKSELLEAYRVHKDFEYETKQYMATIWIDEIPKHDDMRRDSIEDLCYECFDKMIQEMVSIPTGGNDE